MGQGRGSRRRWTEEEKRQIVAQTRIPGMTVAEVARRHEVNTSLVFSWRRDPRLGAQDAAEPRASFVPVEVMAGAMSEGTETVVEVALRNGHRVSVRGELDVEALCRLVHGLAR